MSRDKDAPRVRRGDPPLRAPWTGNPDMADEIESYVCWAPHATLWIWRHLPETAWSYTMSAGANSERSHTGFVGECADPAEAERRAVDACKASRSWYEDGSVVDE